MRYFILSIFLFSFSIAQIKDLSNPLPLDKNVIVDTLNNGLTYYIRKNSEP